MAGSIGTAKTIPGGEWHGGAYMPVEVTQPPARSAPARKLPKHHAALVQQLRRDARQRIKGLNKEIKKAKAGARMQKRRERFHREQMQAAKRIARNQRKIDKSAIKLQKARLRQLHQEIRGFKAQLRASNKAIKLHQRKLKQQAAAHSGRGQRRSAIRAMHHAKKMASWMWLLRQAKKAVQRSTRGRKPDGRNHGYTGVRRKGVTGLAGR